MIKFLERMRGRMDLIFQKDTAAPGSKVHKSTGHCVVAALLVQRELGGDLVSSMVDGQSHWFNRLPIGLDAYDVDLTGDQFGYPEIQVRREGLIYVPTRLRWFKEVNEETLLRYRLFESRYDGNDLGTVSLSHSERQKIIDELVGNVDNWRAAAVLEYAKTKRRAGLNKLMDATLVALREEFGDRLPSKS